MHTKRLSFSKAKLTSETETLRREVIRLWLTPDYYEKSEELSIALGIELEAVRAILFDALTRGELPSNKSWPSVWEPNAKTAIRPPDLLGVSIDHLLRRQLDRRIINRLRTT